MGAEEEWAGVVEQGAAATEAEEEEAGDAVTEAEEEEVGSAATEKAHEKANKKTHSVAAAAAIWVTVARPSAVRVRRLVETKTQLQRVEPSFRVRPGRR